MPWTVASLAGGDDYWHPRADGADPRGALTDGLVPMLAPRGGPFAVLGWSMGGYGALLLAERPPAGLVAAVASSPAVWASFGGAAAGAFDDAADFRAHDVLAGADELRRGPAVRVDCGEDDVFAGTSRRLLEAVPRGGRGHPPRLPRRGHLAELPTCPDRRDRLGPVASSRCRRRQRVTGGRRSTGCVTSRL